MMWKVLSLFLVICVMVSCDQNRQTITVTQAQIPELVGGQTTGVAYMVISNSSSQGIRLTGVSSPVAQMTQIHKTEYDEGVMQMRQKNAIEILPGEQLRLEPGGLHLMLMGVNKPLEEGQKVPLVLEFDDGNTITINAVVYSR